MRAPATNKARYLSEIAGFPFGGASNKARWLTAEAAASVFRRLSSSGCQTQEGQGARLGDLDIKTRAKGLAADAARGGAIDGNSMRSRSPWPGAAKLAAPVLQLNIEKRNLCRLVMDWGFHLYWTAWDDLQNVRRK